MKQLLKKSWFVGSLIFGLMLIIFLLNLWVMSLKLNWPNDDETLWTLSSNISSGDFANIFAFILMLSFYLILTYKLIFKEFSTKLRLLEHKSVT